MKPLVRHHQMKLPVYMDCHSTTQPDPRVISAMMPALQEIYGNPSSTVNRHGQAALQLVNDAREQIARLLGAEPEEVILTSGATESINLVLKGIIRGKTITDVHIVTCVTEHSAVLDTCLVLEQQGARITHLPVSSEGHIDLVDLKAALAQRPTLVSVMHANNEIGVIHPIEQISALCRTYDCPLHLDAAQSCGKIPIQFRQWDIDFMSISGHKFYAPKGIGALLVRRQNPPLRLLPLIHGGGQQRGLRSGTINVPGAVALGAAAEICHDVMSHEMTETRRLRDKLLARIQAKVSDVRVNGCMHHRLPGNLNLSFPGIEPQHLLPMLQDHITVSSGSACRSGSTHPSYILKALDIPDDIAMSSVRYGIGRFNTEAEIDYAADVTIEVVRRIKDIV